MSQALTAICWAPDEHLDKAILVDKVEPNYETMIV